MTESDKPHFPTANRLLASLLEEDFNRLRPHLEHVHFEQKAIIHEKGDSITHVFFPGGGMISLQIVALIGSPPRH